MARAQVWGSEQICSDHTVEIAFDEPLRSRDSFIHAFSKALGIGVSSIKYNGSFVYEYENNGITHYFLTGAITYLSNPHPLFKKRLQLKKWFKDFYEEYSHKNTKVHFMGVYHYKGLYLFVDFDTHDYIGNKMNSSAAHVYTNDLYQGLKNGVFKKIDGLGNHFAVINTESLKGYLSGSALENPVFGLFDKFNKDFLRFRNWIQADDAISEMKEGKFYQWKGAEWAGWYLEYEFSKFLDSENCTDDMRYIGNIKDSSKYDFDFDLFFPKQNFFGDLKASSIKEKASPGNDQETVGSAISKYGKLWYVIYEHDTKKDSDHNNEMAIARMRLMGEKYAPGDHISYADRMKHSVEFLRMKILELNQINMNSVLTPFAQGHNASGEKRRPKYLINKKNIDNFVVYSYETSNEPDFELTIPVEAGYKAAEKSKDSKDKSDE